MIQAEYHLHGGVTSNLIELPNFDIVQSFPLDYMHLVLLGVVRKLLNLWLSKGPVSVCLLKLVSCCYHLNHAFHLNLQGNPEV